MQNYVQDVIYRCEGTSFNWWKNTYLVSYLGQCASDHPSLCRCLHPCLRLKTPDVQSMASINAFRPLVEEVCKCGSSDYAQPMSEKCRPFSDKNKHSATPWTHNEWHIPIWTHIHCAAILRYHGTIVVVQRKGLCGFKMIDVTKKVPNATKIIA